MTPFDDNATNRLALRCAALHCIALHCTPLQSTPFSISALLAAPRIALWDAAIGGLAVAMTLMGR